MLINVFIDFLRKHPRFIWINSMFMLLIPLNEVYLSRLYGKLFDSIQSDNFDKSIFYSIVGLMAFLQIGFALWDYFNSSQSVRFQEFCKLLFVRKTFERYKRKGEEPVIGDTMSKIQKTQQILSDWFGKLFGFFIPIILQLVVTIGYFFVVDRWLGATLLITTFVFVAFMRNAPNTCNANNDRMDKSLTAIHERISDILVNYVSVYKERTLPRELGEVEDMYTEYGSLHKSTTSCTVRYRLALSTVIVVFLIAFVTRSYNILRMKKIQYAVFYSTMMIMTNMLSNMVYMINLYRDMVFDHIHINSSGILDELQMQAYGKCEHKPRHDTFLEIRDVTYTYPGASKPMLKDATLHIRAKDRVALVGEIGTGKSTLLKVVQRLLVPQKGSVYLRRKCLFEYTIKELYMTIGFMPQNSQLFDRSVLENIQYESRDTKREDIMRVMKQFDIDKHFPNGLDAPASGLSGGQKQLVWILRIYFKNCALIVLDEPTASLDVSSKDFFIGLMNTMLKDRTILVVTHDEYMAKACERVVNIQDINKI